MDCKLVKVEQGSDDWLALRRGRITASRLGDVMAKPTTKRYKEYRQELVLELLGFDPPQKDSPEWYKHGKEMEPRAIGAIKWKYDVEGTHDVFAIHKEHDWLGASPDFVTEDEDVYEVKCRKTLINYHNVVDKIAEKADGNIATWVDPAYKYQLQGQILVMGLDSLKYANYCEWTERQIRRLHVITVKRDQELIDKMEIRAMEFMREVYEIACMDIET